MKYYTKNQAADFLGYTPGHILYLIKYGKIKARKINPAKKTSAFLINESELNNYQKNKRCEPCAHIKKQCKICKKLICLNDFPIVIDTIKRTCCKDCHSAITKQNNKK